MGIADEVNEWACVCVKWRWRDFSIVRSNTPIHPPMTHVLHPYRSIIRLIRRLDEAIRQLASAAHAIGDMALKEKFELCSSKIRRDIAFAGACGCMDGWACRWEWREMCGGADVGLTSLLPFLPFNTRTTASLYL